MDSDTANPSKVVAKKIDKIIDMAIVDIFNLRRKGNHIFVDDIKLAWSRLADEEKACLTAKIKNLQRNNKNIVNNISSRELVYYFAKNIIPYKKTKALESKEKRFTEMLIWANFVIECLDRVGEAEKAMRQPKLRKNKFTFKESQEKYNELVNEFYNVYANPTANEKRILKLKLMFNKNKDLLNHLLKERNAWKEILITANIY